MSGSFRCVSRLPEFSFTGGRLLFTAPPAPDMYTLSLHDALPISPHIVDAGEAQQTAKPFRFHLHRPRRRWNRNGFAVRSEEHTSELQSLRPLVCRPLLEKKHDQAYS